MRKILLMFIGLALLLTLIPVKPAYACSCAGTGVQERLARMEAVFVGKAADQSIFTKNLDIGASRLYTFELEQVWKGEGGDRVSVYAAAGPEASCGVKFTKGESYLVYAYRDNQGFLNTNLCSGNLKKSEAAGDLLLLGAGRQMDKQPDNSFHAIGWRSWLPYAGLVLVIAVVWRTRENKLKR